MGNAFFTVGHSNRSLADFTSLLQAAEITLLVDIRKIPASRANPQFNGDTLPDALKDVGIAYERIAALGGLRPGTKAVAADTNGYWTNQSFHHYADYALSAPFREGLQQLIALGEQQRLAIMCAEAVWWRCHRRIVTDYLIAHGQTVFHIMGPGRIDPAHMTPGALPQPDGSIRYPADPAD